MAILFALLAALGFGTGDFFAAIASRRLDSRIVAAVMPALGLVAAMFAALLRHGDGLSGHALLWGVIAGLGSGAGSLLFFHGMSVGRMSIVATLAGLISAVVPVCVGLVQGDPLSTISAIGIVCAVPAIALIAWQPASSAKAANSGALWGILAGFAIALAFVSIDRAGGDSGAWPLVVLQAVAMLIAAPFALRALQAVEWRLPRPGIRILLCAGVVLGLATLLLQAALNSGELAIVVILIALYPGITTLLAHYLLGEHWIKTQQIGLAAALAAVILVSSGAS